MPTKCYYRAGKNKKGKYESCKEVVDNDEERKKFKEKIRNDPSFHSVVSFHAPIEDVEGYLKKYDKRAECPGGNIKTPEKKMCSHLYLIGEKVKVFEEKQKGKDVKMVTVKCEDGKERDFLEEHVCPWDEAHEKGAIPEDVVTIPAFGEAALLITMKRRLTQALNSYTYVGDIVLCLNPYMGLPAMVLIDEYPNQKQYKLGPCVHCFSASPQEPAAPRHSPPPAAPSRLPAPATTKYTHPPIAWAAAWSPPRLI